MSTINAIKGSSLVDGPVRSIGIKSGSISGTLPNGNRYESALERDFMLLMQFDPKVDVYTPQPVTIQFRGAEGRMHRYTPDGLIEWRRDLDVDDPRPVLVEIKYRESFKGAWRNWRERFRAVTEYAKERDWLFAIHTERDIRTQMLENVRFLLPYLRRAGAPETEHWLLEQLANLPESTPRALTSLLYRDKWNQAALISVLWRLLADRKVGFDITQPLTMQTPIWSLR